uniref:Putative ovule protein n=1 Tax=Solanum chacoense TaxID=4108 RepID=A0A0V0H2R1_SOLCH
MAALFYGLKWYANRGFSNVWVETDSMLLTRCIKREWDPPWKINARKLIEEHGYHISHFFREANKPTEKIANLSHGFFRSSLQLFFYPS